MSWSGFLVILTTQCPENGDQRALASGLLVFPPILRLLGWKEQEVMPGSVVSIRAKTGAGPASGALPGAILCGLDIVVGFLQAL